METTAEPLSPGSRSALEALARIECKPMERLLDEAVTDLLNKYREKRDPKVGLALLRDAISEVRANVPTNFSSAEIDADIDAAVEEVRLERLARSH